MTEDTMQASIERIRAQAAGLDLIAGWLEVNEPRLAELSPNSGPKFDFRYDGAEHYSAAVTRYVPGVDLWKAAVRILAESGPEAVTVQEKGNAVEAVRLFGAAVLRVWIMADEFEAGLGPIYPCLDEILDTQPIVGVVSTPSSAASVIDWPHNPLTEFDGGPEGTAA